MIAHSYRALPAATAELADIRNRRVIQRPERVFVKGLDALFQANFDAIRQQVVLAEQILFLDFRVKGRVVFFSD